MSYRGGYQSTIGGDERNDWSRLSQTVATNVQKISQNVNQMQRMVNQIGTSQDSDNLRSNLHEVQHYTNQLAKDTNNNLKELAQLPQPTNVSEQKQRRMLRERLTNDFSEALKNFQVIQRTAASKEKESVIRVRTNSGLNSSNVWNHYSSRKPSNLSNLQRFGSMTNNSCSVRLAGTTPYSLSLRNHLAPMLTVKPMPPRHQVVDVSDELSAASRRILEKLEKASTPVQDARRQPYSSRSELKDYFHSSHYLFRHNKRPKLGPPTGASPLATASTTDYKFPTQKWELKLVPNPDLVAKSASDESSRDDRVGAGEGTDIQRLSENFGGKMVRKMTREERRVPKVPVDDDNRYADTLERLSTVEPLVMPSGAAMPTFSFGASRQPSAKPLPTTTVTKVNADTEEVAPDESPPAFKFTAPVLKRNNKRKPIVDTIKASDIAFSDDNNNKKGSFVFSSPPAPTPTDKSIADSNRNNSTLIKPSITKPMATTTQALQAMPEPPPPTKTTSLSTTTSFNGLDTTPSKHLVLSQKAPQRSSPADSKRSSQSTVDFTSSPFNPPKQTSTPLVPSLKSPTPPPSKPKTPDSSVKAFATTFPPETLSLPPLVSAKPEPIKSDTGAVSANWGDKFKPASGTWNCPVCCITNNADQLRCLACEEPKPGAKIAAKDASKETTTAQKPAFGSGSGFSDAFSMPPVSSQPAPTFAFGGFGAPSPVVSTQSALTSTTTATTFGGFSIPSAAAPVVPQTQSQVSAAPFVFGGFGTTQSTATTASSSTPTPSFVKFGATDSTTTAPVVSQQQSKPETKAPLFTFGGFGSSPTLAVSADDNTKLLFAQKENPLQKKLNTSTGLSSLTSAANKVDVLSSPISTASTKPSLFAGLVTGPAVTTSAPVTASPFMSANPSMSSLLSGKPSNGTTAPKTDLGFGQTDAAFNQPFSSNLFTFGNSSAPAVTSAPTSASTPASNLFTFGNSAAPAVTTAATSSSAPTFGGSQGLSFGGSLGFGGAANPIPATTAPSSAGTFSFSQQQSAPNNISFGVRTGADSAPKSTFGFTNPGLNSGFTPDSQSSGATSSVFGSFGKSSTTAPTFGAPGGGGAATFGQTPARTSLLPQPPSQAKAPTFTFNGFGTNHSTGPSVPQFSTQSQPTAPPAAAAPTAPFSFAGFGKSATPAGAPVPQFQSQPPGGPTPLPGFNFSQQPTFDFASMANAGANPLGPAGAPAGAPLFQFSAESPATQTTATNRFIKKAKRRLNPS